MSRMGRPFDVCIRGAGIVGRALALQLAARRLRVVLVDAPASPATSASGHSDVRAYALNAASRELLQGLRCWPDAAHATPVLSMQVCGDAGGALQFDAANKRPRRSTGSSMCPRLKACWPRRWVFRA